LCHFLEDFARAKPSLSEQDQTVMKYSVVGFISQLGPLRVMLAVLAIISIVFTPDAGTSVVYSGWGLFHTVLVPILAPLIFMVLMLDVMMSRIWMTDKQGAERKRFVTIIMIDLVLGLGILIVWLPFLLALGRP
jgi:Na+-driven multidrug efflux pump